MDSDDVRVLLDNLHCVSPDLDDRAVLKLVSDFNCTAQPGVNRNWGIVLKRNSVLDLNGHTITLMQDQNTLGPVLCDGNCEVHGPGTITNAAPMGGGGIMSQNRGRITAHDLTLSNLTVGIETIGKVVVSRVSIDAAVAGIWVAKKITVDHVDVTLPDTGTRSSCIEASQNGGSVLGHDLTVTGCETGVYATTSVKLTGLKVSNSYIGVLSGKISLTDSAVTGSTSVDLLSKKLPVLVNTTCDTSQRLQDGVGAGTWGVCAND